MYTLCLLVVIYSYMSVATTGATTTFHSGMPQDGQYDRKHMIERMTRAGEGPLCPLPIIWYVSLLWFYYVSPSAPYLNMTIWPLSQPNTMVTFTWPLTIATPLWLHSILMPLISIPIGFWLMPLIVSWSWLSLITLSITSDLACHPLYR